MGAKARVDVPIKVQLGALILALGAFGGDAAPLVAQGALPVSARGTVREARRFASTPVEFPEPFSAVTKMVELRDGRVILHDGKDRRLGVVDFAAGSYSDVARRGQGPLEYRSVSQLHRIAGDSVLVWDSSNGRMLILAPDGRPARTELISPAGNLVASILRPSPDAIDARGRWYAQKYDMTSGRGQRPTTAVTIARFSPATGKTDSLTYLTVKLPPATSLRSGVLAMRPWGFIAADAWGVFPSGTVLMIRGESYTPEVIGANGRSVVAPSIPFAPVRVTEADRAALMEATNAEARGTRAMDNQGRRVDFNVSVTEPESWQEFHPPLLSAEIHVDTRGRAWVHVLDGARASGERYDLLDAQGRLIDAIRLPKGTKFAAMGTDSWYGTREDEDGLVYLQRFPLP
jgi:hypothetical protein